MTLSAWGQSLKVGWKPTLSYFKIRFELLEEIKGTFGSSSFRVDGEQVGLRFKDDLHELDLRPTGLQFNVLTPEFDSSLAKGVLDLVMARLDVGGTAAIVCEMQHLATLDSTYDKARKTTASHILSFVDESLLPDDWSLLADAESPDKSVRFQSEFGIVEKSEIRQRIAQSVGRVRSTERSLPRAWNHLDLPAVAFFASTNASLQKRIAADVEEVWTSWQSVSHYVETFLADVLRGITDGKR